MKPELVSMVRGSFEIFEKDLRATDAELFARRLGEKARSICDIVFEVNLVNDHIGLTIRGEPLFEWPDGGWILAPSSFQDKETALAAFIDSKDRFLAGIEAMSDE